MYDRTEYQRGVNSDSIEGRLLVLEELPEGFFGKSLAS